MAKAWYAGMQQAATNGWINAPIATSVGRGEGACTGKLFWDPVHGQIALGVGQPDVPFTAGWNPVNQLAGGYVGTGDQQGPNVHLAASASYFGEFRPSSLPQI
jgi:hypothetical protein